MSKKLNPDKEKIIQKYVVEEKSLKTVAKELGIGRTTLIRYLKRYGIEKRGRYELHKKIFARKNNPAFKYSITKKFLIKEYVENKLSSEKVAELVGCDRTVIIRNLKYYSIPIRAASEALTGLFNGSKNPNYIDGRSYDVSYPSKFNDTLKEKIRQRDNYTCQNCLMTEEEHLVVFGTNLHIHHIDYIKENCNEDNLITLCNGCNSRANFNRSYWLSFFTNKTGQIKHDAI